MHHLASPFHLRTNHRSFVGPHYCTSQSGLRQNTVVIVPKYRLARDEEERLAASGVFNGYFSMSATHFCDAVSCMCFYGHV
jgi:hypothetical protein